MSFLTSLLCHLRPVNQRQLSAPPVSLVINTQQLGMEAVLVIAYRQD